MSGDRRKPAMPAAAPQPVIVECEVPQPPEKVWRALTVPEHVAAWLLPGDIRAEEGHRFTLTDRRPGDIRCEVLAVEANRLIRYAWRSEDEAAGQGFASTVTFTLRPTEAGGTALRIVHDDFVRLDEQEQAPAGMVMSLPPSRRLVARRPLPRRGMRPHSGMRLLLAA